MWTDVLTSPAEATPFRSWSEPSKIERSLGLPSEHDHGDAGHRVADWLVLPDAYHAPAGLAKGFVDTTVSLYIAPKLW